jgi:hypothetical protein
LRGFRGRLCSGLDLFRARNLRVRHVANDAPHGRSCLRFALNRCANGGYRRKGLLGDISSQWQNVTVEAGSGGEDRERFSVGWPERQPTLRDVYEVTIPVLSDGRQLDWRVGVAMAVALDTLQRRWHQNAGTSAFG